MPIAFRLTELEAERLQRFAAAEHMKSGAYVRRLLRLHLWRKLDQEKKTRQAARELISLLDDGGGLEKG